MMLPRRFVFAFHAGLAVSVALVLRGDPLTMRYLFWIGSVHVLALFLLGFRLPAPRDRLVVQTLHKAGFLHTLMGLAAAVVAVATSAGSADDAASATGLVLAPMGAALVPHIMGVWLGHWVEVRNATVDIPFEDLKKRLADLSENSFTLLDELEMRLKRLNGELGTLAGECAMASRRTGEAMNDLQTTASATAHSAKNFNDSVGEVAKTTGQIAIVHQQLIELMRSPIFHPVRTAAAGR